MKRSVRRGILGSSALLLVMAASTAAQAQCSGNVAGQFTQIFSPLALGGASTINSINAVLNTANTAFLAQGTAFIGSPANPEPHQLGGGVWVRGIGGKLNIDNVGTSTTTTTGAGPLAGITGTITCPTTTEQTFGGYQVGADIGKFNINGWNFHYGTTAGYVESDAKTKGGTFKGNFKIPYVGLYGAVTGGGGWFADALLRWDYYENSISDVSNGIQDQLFNARGFSVSGGLGYHAALRDGWFIEPSAGVIWSKVDVDPLLVAGSFITTPLGLGPPGSVNFSDVESLLGRASIRGGKNFVAGNLALQAFGTASVWHEFKGDSTATVTGDFGLLVPGGNILGITGATSTLSSTRVGTYGQFAIGLAGQVIDTGWLGYVRGDYRVGDNIDGWTINGGLRYQFDPVKVAGGPVGKGPVYKAPVAPVQVAYNWTGFYIGGNAGATWGEGKWHETTGVNFDVEYAGFLGGGQAGFNYQLGKWVLSIEADAGWTNAKGAAGCPVGGFFFNCEQQVDWLATVTGRVGYAWFDRLLMYVKGGFAAGDVTVQTVNNIPGIAIPPSGTRTNGTSQTATGWTIGYGTEFALTNNWTVKSEYLYYRLGKDSYLVDNGIREDVEVRGNIIRIGLNYKFGVPPAVVARY